MTDADRITEGIGRASEALEYVERARGHLYSLHQLIGRADFLFEEAADLLRSDDAEAAEHLDEEIVGRNVLDGRWTFQIVEEFDELYYSPLVAAVRSLEAKHHGGRRHVFESEMKEQRRSAGRTGHERRPPLAHDDRIETDGP